MLGHFLRWKGGEEESSEKILDKDGNNASGKGSLSPSSTAPLSSDTPSGSPCKNIQLLSQKEARSQNPFYIRSAIKSKKPLKLSTINKILNSSEGRDKITKVFQYLWCLLAYVYFKQQNRAKHKFYTGLYRAFQQARKVSHLLSSLSEWEKSLSEFTELRKMMEEKKEGRRID